MADQTKRKKAAAKTTKATAKKAAAEAAAASTTEPAATVEPVADAPAATTVTTTAPGDPAAATDEVELARRVSGQIVGTLTVHYAARDVDIRIDGAHALDILSLFASGGIPQAFDPIGSTTVAATGFTVLDTTTPLGMTWTPTGLAGVAKTTVDPGEPIA